MSVFIDFLFRSIGALVRVLAIVLALLTFAILSGLPSEWALFAKVLMVGFFALGAAGHLLFKVGLNLETDRPLQGERLSQGFVAITVTVFVVYLFQMLYRTQLFDLYNIRTFLPYIAFFPVATTVNVAASHAFTAINVNNGHKKKRIDTSRLVDSADDDAEVLDDSGEVDERYIGSE